MTSDAYEVQTAPRAVRWSAPELLRTGPVFSLKSDVWSFGVLLWECFSGGRLPYYYYPETREVVKAVADRQETPSRPESCPAEVFKVMESCWAQRGRDRPSFQELHAALVCLQAQLPDELAATSVTSVAKEQDGYLNSSADFGTGSTASYYYDGDDG
jgi:serine/threonine protein kinase